MLSPTGVHLAELRRRDMTARATRERLLAQVRPNRVAALGDLPGARPRLRLVPLRTRWALGLLADFPVRYSVGDRAGSAAGTR